MHPSVRGGDCSSRKACAEARLVLDRMCCVAADFSLSGRMHSAAILDICCELKGLEEAEKAHGWPQRAGKTVLQLALTRLARHYGLLRAEAPGGRRQILRHWGSEDYRPSIDGWKTRPDQ